jgi:DNA-binding NarL/FixJ family response regulator
METNQLLEGISKKLGVLIALDLDARNNKATISQNVEMLNRFGLSAHEIANIIGTSKNTVEVTKSRLKKLNK